jgi:hypothetical protein
MILKAFFQRFVYLLYRTGYCGDIEMVNLDVLRSHEGPGILIANHQTMIDLYVPFLLNTILKRQVHVLAAAYAFQNRLKQFIGDQLNVLLVTKRLSLEDLQYMANRLDIAASEAEVTDAYAYYHTLSRAFNKGANEKIKNILSSNGLVFSFAQFFQPYLDLEVASDGLGRLISRHSDVPVFPVSILDCSEPPVEWRVRSKSSDLKRLDLLTDKRRKHFAGTVKVIFNEPIVLKESFRQQCDHRAITDEVMMYLCSKIPPGVRGYYNKVPSTKDLKYFVQWGQIGARGS